MTVRKSNGQFVKGQSGNPNGRPRKSRAISTMLRTIGAQKTEEGLTKRRALALKVWEMALNGDLSAARLIYEYCDGKPTQQIQADVTNKGEPFVVVKVGGIDLDNLK